VTGHADAVRAMFTRIAGRYDLMNTVMTAGRHHAWRRVAAAAVREAPPGPVLDVATGTADLALAVRETCPERLVIGVDFAEAMLREGRRKLAARGERRVPLAVADALALPFAPASFACVTSAFLLRNLVDLQAGLAEMRRVTRPGGLVLALEIVPPAARVWGTIFGACFGRLVPAVGAVVARDRRAYTYLPRSVAGFVGASELGDVMARAGLRDVRHRRLGLGTIALHRGRV
jgi:demethylmenaquinone methyltransferase / 2-methoxy-6-polyprenyl-1,4-benzoquinol methylase